ncbi:hypothetical protein HUJ05_012228 [Dendroctonus ponderosae]|nr:hypothetical protein HUJ05_012228 [Dendroctonus ponderosae]
MGKLTAVDELKLPRVEIQTRCHGKSPQEEYTLYSNLTPDTYNINIIQAYVLTSHHTDEEVDRFYDDIRAISRHHYPVTITTALLQLGTKTESNLSESTTRKLQQRRDVTSDKPTTDEELRHFNR